MQIGALISVETHFKTLLLTNNENYLRDNLHQSERNGATLLCIESALMDSINFNDIIDILAETKAGKKLSVMIFFIT